MSENREAYQAAMREAHALAWALKWEAASLKYRESLDEFPNDPTARLSLAVALSKTGHLTEAIDEYEKVRLLLPRDPLVVTRIAELYLRLSLNEKAIQAYLDAAKLHLELDERPKAQNAWRLALEHSQSNRRSLLALRQALTSASEKSLLPDVEEALDQAIDVAPTPAIGTGKPSTSIEPGGTESEVEPGSKVDKTEPEASIESIATIKTIINAPDSSLRHSDPASLLAFADAHASKGEAALALCEYLQASERLGNTAARGAARRAAQSLGQDWLVGDLDDLLAVPPEIRFDLADALRQSYLHLKDKKHESALDEAWRAVSLSPGFLPAHLRLSQIQYAMGDRDASRERLAMVADLYRLAGDAERSIAVLRQQVSLEPDEPKTRQTLITGLISVGENEQAASELDSWAKHLREGGDIYGSLAHEREAIKLAPRPDRYLRLGLELEALGEVGEALGAYNKARALAPAEEVIAAGEARCQGILGLWDEMEENLAYVTEQISTDSILAESILADALRSFGRYDELAPFRYWLGTVLRAHGQSDPATEQLTLAAGDESRAGKLARFALGEIFQAQGKPTEAIARFWSLGDPRAISDRREKELAENAHRALADISARIGDWAGATRALETLASLHPSEETLLSTLAEAAVKAQSPEKAAAALEGLARLNEERGEMMPATALRRAVIGLRPEDPQPHEKLAQMLLDALSAEGAEPDQTSREDAQNEFDEAARLYEAHGQTDRAVACLRKLLDLTRQIDVARALLVRERLATLQPDDIALRHDLVEAYLKSGRSVRALGEARALTDYLIESAQLEEAAKSLRVVVRLDPWNQTEKARLGSLLAILGQTEEARRLLGAVLAREPENQTALRALEKIDRASREAVDDSSANSEEKSNIIATQPSEIDGASEGQRITDRPGVRDVTNLAEGSISDDPTVVNIDLIDQKIDQAIGHNMIVEASSAMGGTTGGQTEETEANEA